MNFYVDVSAVGVEYQTYSDVPATFGVPQDGNGRASNAATAAVGIATIDVAGCSASGAGIVGVLGVTVSSTLNASGAALATAIAAAINACATTVGSTYSAATLPLNKLVYARVNPALNTQVQIMLRIAGADWSTFAPTQSGITPAATISTFNGGADGPFGYFFSSITGVFGKAITEWGAFAKYRVGGINEPDLSTPIYIRTRRDGVDLGLAITTSTQLSPYLVPSTSGTNHRLGVFDNGTVWPGDAGVFTADIFTTSGAGSSSLMIGPANQGNNALYLFSADKVKRGRFYLGGQYYGWYVNAGYSSARVVTEDILFEARSNMVNGNGIGFNMGGASSVVRCSRTKFIVKGGGVWQMGSGASDSTGVFSQCEFEYFGLTGNVSGIVNGTPAGNFSLEFLGCKFYDRLGVFNIVDPVRTSYAGSVAFRIAFDGCSGISDVSLNMPAHKTSERVLTWDDFDNDRAFRVEKGAWMSEWRPNNGHPTLTAKTISDTPWSIKTIIRSVMDANANTRIVRIFERYLAATAVRTLSVEVLAPAGLTKSQLFLSVQYVDADGVARTEDSATGLVKALTGIDEALTVSSAAWDMNGQSGYVKYRLDVTTAYAIKANSDLNVYVLWCGSPDVDFAIYTNPEVAIA